MIPLCNFVEKISTPIKGLLLVSVIVPDKLFCACIVVTPSNNRKLNIFFICHLLYVGMSDTKLNRNAIAFVYLT